MPIFEYQHLLGECIDEKEIVEVLQDVGEAALTHCPTCGMPVRRVVSRASMAVAPTVNPDKAASRGFSTFKKSGKGHWEKIAGPGVDAIVDPDRL